jgi:hypothetical protein
MEDKMINKQKIVATSGWVYGKSVWELDSKEALGLAEHIFYMVGRDAYDAISEMRSNRGLSTDAPAKNTSLFKFRQLSPSEQSVVADINFAEWSVL